MADEEESVMVFDHESQTWNHQIMTAGEFERRKPAGEVLLMEQFDAMIARLPGIEKTSWQEAEKYGFDETALSFDDARDALDNDSAGG